jgi:CheY-like chemotaxis protein
MSTAIFPMEVLIVEADDLPTAVALDRIRSDRVKVRTVKGMDSLKDELSGRGAHGDPDRFSKPALVILDVLLPKTETIDLIEDLIEDPTTHGTSVAAIYTSEFHEECAAEYNGELRVFVSRPINPLEYNQRVREIIRYWTTDRGDLNGLCNLSQAECPADRFYHLLADGGQGCTTPAKIPPGIEEKRAHPRSVFVSTGPACSVILEPMAVRGTLIDFSQHGCRVAVNDSIFESGDDVVLQVLIPGLRPYQLRAVARHCHEGWVGFSIL